VDLIQINFYRQQDLISVDRKSWDYSRLAHLGPLDSIRARVRGLFRMQLEHLGYSISQSRPDLEGKTLEANLELRRVAQGVNLPVIRAVHDGKSVAEMPVCSGSLDMKTLEDALYRRNPDLTPVPLACTFGPVS